MPFPGSGWLQPGRPLAALDTAPAVRTVSDSVSKRERGSTIAWFVSPYDEVNQAVAEALSRERVSPESNNQGW
jgi:hypothetical protein